MKWHHLLYILFSLSLFSHPTGLETIQGMATLEKENGQLLIHASDGAILHWKDFSIKEGERMEFFQPQETSWVLNRVIGDAASEIFGTLTANGQIVLMNPHGILFGENAFVDVGGIIASTLNEGPIVNKGLIRARNGDVLLVGKTVDSFGRIEGAAQLTARVEDNPYRLVINGTYPEEATRIKASNGRIFLTSEKRTQVAHDSTLMSEGIVLLSEGVTLFQGHAEVGNGSIEVSGREGFYYQGTTDRQGGALILDPESDITISKLPFYNYSFEEGSPTTDHSNIPINFLLSEIKKGPVTITTSYQGEGGAAGSIYIKDDVSHTYESPYPLIFNCSGTGGIHVAGKLKNHGTGEISFNAREIAITGEVEGSKINIQGFLKCQGNLYGKTLDIFSSNGGLVTGKIIAEDGPITWLGGGTLSLKGGEIGDEKNGPLTLKGLENITLEDHSRLFTFSANLSVLELSGTLSLENSTLLSGGPIIISGNQGALYLNNGTLQSNSSLNINLGQYLHSHNSLIQAEQPIDLTLGNDLILSEKSLLTSTKGISLETKSSLLISNDSTVKGPGVSLVVGESTSLLDSSRIDGEKGFLSVISGKDLTMEGYQPVIQGGQVSIHIGGEMALENHSKITSSQGPVAVTVRKRLSLFDNGSISASGGDLALFITQENLTLYGSSSLNSLTHGGHIIVGKSIRLENFSSIHSFGEKGVTIVVDHLNRGGGISTALNSSISTGYAPLRVFTASPYSNSIEGSLNHHHYSSKLPLYLTTSQAHWGISYPSELYALPFTVFHKDNGLIQTTIGHVNQKTLTRHIVNFIGPYTAELFRDLSPYDQYIKESITFTDNGQTYFIRRRTEK